MGNRVFPFVVLMFACGALSLMAQTPVEPSVKAEMQICTAVVDRMPQNAGTVFPVDVDSVFCWSRITGLVGENSVVHVWLHKGEEVGRITLPVLSTSWRSWSIKKLHGMTGDWEVRAEDTAGRLLGSTTFQISETPNQD